MVAAASWGKMRVNTSATAKVFPVVTAAYKSWHPLEFEIDLTDFSALASQPLFNKRHITYRGPVAGEAVAPSPIKPPAIYARDARANESSPMG